MIKVNIVKMVILLKATNRIKESLIKIPVELCTEIGKVILTLHTETQKFRRVETIPDNKTSAEVSPFQVSSYSTKL